jgi:signal peptidase I
MMFALVALVGLASILCNSGAWLWMAAKWCRIPSVSYLRALAAVSLVTVINVSLRLAGLGLIDRTEGGIGRMILVYALLMIVAGTLCIKWVLRTTTRRALGAGFITIVISSAMALPVLVVIQHFVMESFVVPSGSMAPAVIGKHFDLTCPRCGLPFFASAYDRFQMQQSARGRQAAGRFSEPLREELALCPNCRTQLPLPDALPISEGDKFLVDKLSHPRRWDVVAFKFPEHIDTSYIKRLVGLPGETVEIVGGDIFVNGWREAKPFAVARELWVPVNDTRFQPADLQPDDPQWQPEEAASHWQQAAGSWQFTGSQAEGEKLIFAGPLTDESYYTERWSEDQRQSEFEEWQPISDVQVTCTFAGFSGTGTIGFLWKFQGIDAAATLSASGAVELRSAKESSQGRMTHPISSVKSVGFAVRDRVGIFFADGSEMARLVIGPQSIESAREALKQATDPCQIAVIADHCDLEFSRILLERDVYYRSGFSGSMDCNGCTGRPIVLGPREHYVLGDHSPRANDSRFWRTIDDRPGNRYQAGTVPTELMIGTARCIYWPPRRWREFR